MKDIDDAKKHSFQFWETQPVPTFNESITESTFIKPPIEKSELRVEPYSLPEPFVWSDINIYDDNELGELYLLLNENYVEDDENMFRFDYSKEFLKWAVLVPGWKKHYLCSVRAGYSGKLIAFISAIPAKIRVYDKSVEMVEINFLCVHKKLRTKRLAPVLIREITRRVNLEGIFQATFTAGIVIPKPVSACRYWHRSLNPKKLIETNFSQITRNMTLQRTLKLYRLSDEPHLTNLKPLDASHIQSAFKLVSNYLNKFKLLPEFSEEEFSHLFLPRKDVVYCYVIETDGQVTDFLSFYCLPSSVMHHPIHKTIKAAYSFYNVATTVTLTRLMHDALIIAKKEQFDVFNALDLMENKTFLKELKFGIGDSDLQYYLYNWKCPNLKSEQIGLVLQ